MVYHNGKVYTETGRLAYPTCGTLDVWIKEGEENTVPDEEETLSLPVKEISIGHDSTEFETQLKLTGTEGNESYCFMPMTYAK